MNFEKQKNNITEKLKCVGGVVCDAERLATAETKVLAIDVFAKDIEVTANGVFVNFWTGKTHVRSKIQYVLDLYYLDRLKKAANRQIKKLTRNLGRRKISASHQNTKL